MGGLFELVFILVFIVAAVLDATSRRKKRQRQKEEMEAKEQGPSGRPARQGETSGGEAPGRAPATEASSGEGESRETADQMVADDFWAILTGQPRPERPSGSEAEDAPSEVRGEDGRYEPAPAREGRGREGEGRGTGDDGERSMDRPGDAPDRVRLEDWDARGRRGDRSPPKEANIPVPLPGDRYRRAPDGGAGASGEDDIARQEAELFGEQAEPWLRMDDISEGEIGDGTGGIGEDEDGPTSAPGRPRSRRGTAGRYTRLLESGSMEDLRKAVVLREVLDQPLGLRPGRSGGRGWTDEDAA